MLFHKLTAAQEGSTIVLGERQHLLLPSRTPESANTVSSSAWAHAAIWPQQGAISNSSVNSGLFSLCQSHSSGPQTPVLCTVSGGGKTVASGTLELDEHACIVFDESCVDTCIEGTILKGVVMVVERACMLFGGLVCAEWPCMCLVALYVPSSRRLLSEMLSHVCRTYHCRSNPQRCSGVFMYRRLA